MLKWIWSKMPTELTEWRKETAPSENRSIETESTDRKNAIRKVSSSEKDNPSKVIKENTPEFILLCGHYENSTRIVFDNAERVDDRIYFYRSYGETEIYVGSTRADSIKEDRHFLEEIYD